MNFVIKSDGVNYILDIPNGLNELMMDISREVLRENVENIYCFIADYLDALLITREHTRIAASIVASLTDTSATVAELLIRTGMTRSQAELSAGIMQHAFKEHSIRREQGDPEMLQEYTILRQIIEVNNISPEQAMKAASVIQSAFSTYRQRQRDATIVVSGLPTIECAKNTLDALQKMQPTSEELNYAATLIQSAYRGYYARKLSNEVYQGEDIDETTTLEMDIDIQKLKAQQEEYEAKRLLLKEEMAKYDSGNSEFRMNIIEEINMLQAKKQLIDATKLAQAQEWAAITIQRAFRNVYQRPDRVQELKEVHDLAARNIQRAFRKTLLERKEQKEIEENEDAPPVEENIKPAVEEGDDDDDN